MMKFIATVAVGLAFASPAFAQEQALACDEATITKVQAAVDAVADPAKKEAATVDLQAAKDAMAASNAEACAAALKKASDAAVVQ